MPEQSKLRPEYFPQGSGNSFKMCFIARGTIEHIEMFPAPRDKLWFIDCSGINYII